PLFTVVCGHFCPCVGVGGIRFRSLGTREWERQRKGRPQAAPKTWLKFSLIAYGTICIWATLGPTGDAPIALVSSIVIKRPKSANVVSDLISASLRPFT